jgi:hypothetical protein
MLHRGGMLQDKFVEVASVVSLMEISFALKAGLTIHLAYIHSFIGFMTSLPFEYPNSRTRILSISLPRVW